MNPRNWVWVVENGRRFYVQILRYVADSPTYKDVYVVKFANGDTRAYAGVEVQKWNEEEEEEE
jgi:hypothetical protein